MKTKKAHTPGPWRVVGSCVSLGPPLPKRRENNLGFTITRSHVKITQNHGGIKMTKRKISKADEKERRRLKKVFELLADKNYPFKLSESGKGAFEKIGLRRVYV